LFGLPVVQSDKKLAAAEFPYRMNIRRNRLAEIQDRRGRRRRTRRVALRPIEDIVAEPLRPFSGSSFS